MIIVNQIIERMMALIMMKMVLTTMKMTLTTMMTDTNKLQSYPDFENSPAYSVCVREMKTLQGFKNKINNFKHTPV